MKIEFAARTWDIDTAHISFRQGLAIQKQTGMSIADWEDSLDFKKDDEGKIANPPMEWLVSVGALYWLMLAQNGEEADPDTMDFDWSAFLQAYFAALAAEIARLKAEAAPPPDPTSPAPAGPASPVPSTPTATTPPPPAPPEGAATAS
jgi:hypothetical protein